MKRYAVAVCSTDDGASMIMQFIYAENELDAMKKHPMIQQMPDRDEHENLDSLCQAAFEDYNFICGIAEVTGV